MALERLRQAPWLARAGVRGVFEVLGGVDKVRAVGGAVRDALLGVSSAEAEVDFASVHTPEVVIELGEAHGVKCVPTGLDHGTVTLVFPDGAYEVTSLREDVATDGRHAKVAFSTDWEADARRRDFTLNALYCGPKGELFDPLGGLVDCLSRRVRFIGIADERIGEDRLRVYRFFRFSARFSGQKLDADGLAAARRSADKLAQLSPERVGQEMCGMLRLPAVAKTLEKMAETGVLQLGEQALPGFVRYEALADKPELGARLALFGAAWGFAHLQEVWRLSNALRREAERLHACAGKIGTADLFHAAWACQDLRGVALPLAGAMRGWNKGQLAAKMSALNGVEVPPFPVGGRDLQALGFATGPELGRALARLREDWIGSGFTLGRATLLDRARDMAGHDPD